MQQICRHEEQRAWWVWLLLYLPASPSVSHHTYEIFSHTPSRVYMVILLCIFCFPRQVCESKSWWQRVCLRVSTKSSWTGCGATITPACTSSRTGLDAQSGSMYVHVIPSCTYWFQIMYVYVLTCMECWTYMCTCAFSRRTSPFMSNTAQPFLGYYQVSPDASGLFQNAPAIWSRQSALGLGLMLGLKLGYFSARVKEGYSRAWIKDRVF